MKKHLFCSQVCWCSRAWRQLKLREPSRPWWQTFPLPLRQATLTLRRVSIASRNWMGIRRCFDRCSTRARQPW